MEGDLRWRGEHRVQCTGDVLWNCAPETRIVLLTSVSPINSIKKGKKGKKRKSAKDIDILIMRIYEQQMMT